MASSDAFNRVAGWAKRMVESIAVRAEPSPPRGDPSPGLMARGDRLASLPWKAQSSSRRHAEERRAQRGDAPPETFGVHISGKTRKGDFTICRRLSWKKFQAKPLAIKTELLRGIHHDLAQVGRWLRSVFQGRVQCHAVPGSSARLQRFQAKIQVMWLRVLR